MKLYVYKNANIHTQDTIPEYVDTTPFSQKGIARHCKVVEDPDEADFFYMGQVSDGNMDDPKNILTEESFIHLPGKSNKHILDIEGDWCEVKAFTACGYGRSVAPPWVLQCIKSCSASKYSHWVPPVMARPHLSQLLAFLKDGPECEIEFPDSVGFGFRGQRDPLNTRQRLFDCLNKAGIKNEVNFNTSWGARKGLDSPAVSAYIDSLYTNLISLCPEGVCSATIRFYETCFFARVPVIVGEQMILEEGSYDTSFVYKIDPKCSDDELTVQLQKIADTPHAELVEKGKAARQYFINVVMKYFEDPTLYFINWMKRNNLYQG